MIPVMSWRNMMIERRVVISRAIFSPLSGGNVNPRTHMKEMSTHGKMRLNKKYKVRRRMLMTNMTNENFSVQHSYFFDSEYDVTS